MISGKIITYKVAPTTTYYKSSNEMNYWDQSESYFNHMPPFHEQHNVLNSMLNTAYKAGFKIGARVRRKYPTNSKTEGTIIHIHESFGMAWNYTTGILEPLKVQWDSEDNLAKCFDYDPEELILIEDNHIMETTQHENLSNLHQSC